MVLSELTLVVVLAAALVVVEVTMLGTNIVLLLKTVDVDELRGAALRVVGPPGRSVGNI